MNSYIKPGTSKLLKLFRNIFIIFVIITIIWCLYINIEITPTTQSRRIINNINTFFNDSDNTMCYKNFVFNKFNEKYRFPDMADDEILQQNNGQNVFFHLSNCIHDGIPKINFR